MAADEALGFMQYDSDTTRRADVVTQTTPPPQWTTSLQTTRGRVLKFEFNVAFSPQERDTLSNMTLPPHLMVDGAIAAINVMMAHLEHWGSNGKNWVKGLASKGKARGGIVVASRSRRARLCEHKHREGKLGEFKDLTDDGIKLVVKAAWQLTSLPKTSKNI